MNRCVIDASITLAWLLNDESSDYADAILRSLQNGVMLTPPHWTLEVTNALLVAERRGRITLADTVRALTLLDALPIESEEKTSIRARTDCLSLARNYRLSIYDAAYMELTLRQGVPIATLNKELVAACKNSGAAIATGAPGTATNPHLS